ncbi:hypothetical protein N1078_16620 [Pseudomonas sp. MIL19]|uniref:PilX N-terminal domain-containing pilus assembly protein n=1 Tax=Pseudomonas sp. MIL19 TaxID=2976979 RepID=UPI00236487F9|nr:PilX N-terminal domain-containing pilus assembly protein [Pseudomonas sp. MIL19]MDD2162197.1 hypothetical protein [Pseudomonas sp. MIL19]
MIQLSTCRGQQGVALIVGLIMLLLLTLVVGSAFTLSGTNLKAVGNMQLRNEAIAAANAAIEQKVSSDLTAAPTAEPIEVAINGVVYTVDVEPTCVSSRLASYASASGLSGEETKDYRGRGAPMTNSGYNVILDLKADVVDEASGAAVTVRSGVRVLLNESQRKAVCS